MYMSNNQATTHPIAFKPNWWARAGWIALAVYIVYACSLLDFTWARFMVGLDNGARFIGRMFPPNFSRWEILTKGLAESLEIAVLASALGILVSLPIGLLASRNLMPPWVTWPARMFIALCRSFHPVIVAIVFVKAIGFGALSGIGGALFAAFQRFDYDFVCAMLLAIIFLIFVGEVLATRVRAIFLERGKVDEE